MVGGGRGSDGGNIGGKVAVVVPEFRSGEDDNGGVARLDELFGKGDAPCSMRSTGKHNHGDKRTYICKHTEMIQDVTGE